MRRAVERVAEVARVVAPDEDVPRLRSARRVAQRRERDAVLGAPAVGVDARRGVVEEVGREVLVAVGVVEEAVGLDAARIDAQLDGGAPVVARVEEDGDVVVGADDVVALDERRADLLRIGIVGSGCRCRSSGRRR